MATPNATAPTNGTPDALAARGQSVSPTAPAGNTRSRLWALGSRAGAKPKTKITREIQGEKHTLTIDAPLTDLTREAVAALAESHGGSQAISGDLAAGKVATGWRLSPADAVECAGLILG